MISENHESDGVPKECSFTNANGYLINDSDQKSVRYTWYLKSPRFVILGVFGADEVVEKVELSEALSFLNGFSEFNA